MQVPRSAPPSACNPPPSCVVHIALQRCCEQHPRRSHLVVSHPFPPSLYSPSSPKATLKKAWSTLKTEYTKVYNNWSASGQMGSSDKKGRETFSDFTVEEEEEEESDEAFSSDDDDDEDDEDDKEEEEEEGAAAGSGGAAAGSGGAAAAAATKPKGGGKRKRQEGGGADTTLFEPLKNLDRMKPWTDFTSKSTWNPAVLVYMHEVVKNEPSLNPFLVRLLSTPMEGNGTHVHKRRRSTAGAVGGGNENGRRGAEPSWADKADMLQNLMTSTGNEEQLVKNQVELTQAKIAAIPTQKALEEKALERADVDLAASDSNTNSDSNFLTLI